MGFVASIYGPLVFQKWQLENRSEMQASIININQKNQLHLIKNASMQSILAETQLYSFYSPLGMLTLTKRQSKTEHKLKDPSE